ncbi:hypothetical protein ACWEKT_15345 [Nocardia takedensis]
MPVSYDVVERDVVERGIVPVAAGMVEELLGRLAELHRLVDSDFADPRWSAAPTATDPTCRLLALRDRQPVGFLAGRPRTGHIALIGSLSPGNGAGAAMLDAFAQRAATAGAAHLSVVLDTEIDHRWQRRHFFETNGFRPDQGSALHFIRPL